MQRARGAIAVAGGALLLLLFVQRFVLVELFVWRAGAAMAGAALVALAATGVGRLFRRDRDFVRNLVVGLPLFGAICFLLGLLGVNAWTMSLPLVLLVFSGVPAASPAPEREGAGEDAGAPLRTFAIAALAIVAACGFVLAQAPPSSLDELAYHLAVPRAWVNEGRAVALPLLSHSYFPLGVESASLPLLVMFGSVNGGIASHFLHLIAAAAACVLLYRFVRRRASGGTAWLITAAAATTPALAITAGWSLVEWPLLAICIALVDALERDDDRTLGAALAAGLLAKYTFLPFALLALIAARRWRVPLASLAGTLFFVRNLILTGNPVAPFFSSNAPHVSGYRGGPSIAGAIFEGTFLDESLGAAVLVLLFLTRGRMGWAIFAGGAALFALSPSTRVLLPFLIIPAAMTSLDDLPPIVRRVVSGIAIAAIAVQTVLVAYFVDRTGAFKLLGGSVTDAQYLAQQRPSFPAVAWLNAALPQGSRTLVVGLNETYWFAHRVRGGGNFDGERISRYLEAPTAEALRERLRGDGITHVAVVAQRPVTTVRQKLEERQTTLSPAAQRNVAELLDRFAAGVSSRGDATLFALR